MAQEQYLIFIIFNPNLNKVKSLEYPLDPYLIILK